MLDQEAINEFKELYWQGYGIQLTDQQALEYGTKLVQLVRVVYDKNLPPLPKNVDKQDKEDNN